MIIPVFFTQTGTNQPGSRWGKFQEKTRISRRTQTIQGQHHIKILTNLGLPGRVRRIALTQTSPQREGGRLVGYVSTLDSTRRVRVGSAEGPPQLAQGTHADPTQGLVVRHAPTSNSLFTRDFPRNYNREKSIAQCRIVDYSHSQYKKQLQHGHANFKGYTQGVQ